MNLESLAFQVNLPEKLFKFIVIYSEKCVFNLLIPLAIPPKNNANDKKSFHKISEDALINQLQTKNHIQNTYFLNVFYSDFILQRKSHDWHEKHVWKTCK